MSFMPTNSASSPTLNEPQITHNPVHDMQVLLMDLQTLGSITSTRENEQDKFVDRLIMTALYLKSIDRELRSKCLYFACLFVRPTLNVTLILGEWPEMVRLISRVYPKLQKNPNNPANLHCMECIDYIKSFMTSYTRDNTGYNPSSSVPNNNNRTQNHTVVRSVHPPSSHNTTWPPPYVPPPMGPHHTSNGERYVYASSIATQENV